ncbi:rhomboid family intramembrane serine protease [Thermosulfuriphilus sp.]
MIPIQDSIPRRCPPVATWTLIGLNALVFLLEISLPEKRLEQLFYLFGIVPARYTHPDWAVWFGLPLDDYWPFLTSMFLHGSWVHFIGNMWTLWIFGDNVEDQMGPWRYLIFYLLCGLAAGVVHVILNPHSTVPTIGASGAISGVMGAYYALFPLARIIVMIPIFIFPFFFELPAILYLGLWFLIQFTSGTLSLALPGAHGGIAWWAHVGGFVAGIVLYRFFLSSGRPCHYYPDESIPWGVNWPQGHQNYH